MVKPKFSTIAVKSSQLDSLKSAVEAKNLFETAEGNNRRLEALKIIESILPLGWHTPQDFLFFPVGSYNIGIHSPGSDIDALVVGNLMRRGRVPLTKN